MQTSRALIIFAKKPVPGRVKTRLSPPLTFEEGAELYSCMLKDTLTRARLLTNITPVIFFQPDPGAEDYFQKIAPDLESFPQRGNSLGERMKSAFSRMFDSGNAEVVIIGSDSPDLPAEYIVQAFNLMGDEHTDGVFGPAEDGGYYLLALKRVWLELFENIPWSSGEVLQSSVEKANDACINMALLPLWHDVDTFADLARPELLDRSSPALLTRKFITEKMQIRMHQLPHQVRTSTS